MANEINDLDNMGSADVRYSANLCATPAPSGATTSTWSVSDETTPDPCRRLACRVDELGRPTAAKVGFLAGEASTPASTNSQDSISRRPEGPRRYRFGGSIPSSLVSVSVIRFSGLWCRIHVPGAAPLCPGRPAIGISGVWSPVSHPQAANRGVVQYSRYSSILGTRNQPGACASTQ